MESIDIRPICAAVAAALGATLETSEDWRANLKLEDCALFIRREGKRLEVKPSLPGSRTVSGVLSYEENRDPAIVTGISVSAERSAEAIAREITRRLVPSARLICQRGREYDERATKYEREKTAARERIAKAIGQTNRTERDSFYFKSTMISVEPNSVQFDRLSVSESVALEIIEVLRKVPS